jgi:hypothetical protein
MKTYTIEVVMPNIPKSIRQVVASSVKVVGDYFVFEDEKGNAIAHYSTKNTIIKTITKSWKSYTEKNETEDTKKSNKNWG